MRRVCFVSFGAFLLVAGGFLFSQERETEIDRLSRQVEALRKEVSLLANQVEQLKKNMAELSNQQIPATPPGIPPGAAEKEINGVKYYIVPVKKIPDAEAP